MKKQGRVSRKSVKMSVLTSLVVATFLCFGTISVASAKAHNGFGEEETANKGVDSVKANRLSVKYLGSTDDSLEFDVRYSNQKGNTFSFVVKDENGEVLFEKQYNAKVFNKKIRFPKGMEDANKISFSIISDTDKVALTKEVVIKTRFVEDVLVRIN